MANNADTTTKGSLQDAALELIDADRRAISYLSAELYISPVPQLTSLLSTVADTIRKRGSIVYDCNKRLVWRDADSTPPTSNHAVSFDRLDLIIPPSNVIAASRSRTASHELLQSAEGLAATVDQAVLDIRPLRSRLPGSADNVCDASQQVVSRLDERMFAPTNESWRDAADPCFFKIMTESRNQGLKLLGSKMTLGTATARTNDGGEVDFELSCKPVVSAPQGSSLYADIERYLCGDHAVESETPEAQGTRCEDLEEEPRATYVRLADVHLNPIDELAETIEPTAADMFGQLPRRTASTPSRPSPEPLTP